MSKTAVRFAFLLLTAHCLLPTVYGFAAQPRIAILTPEKNQQIEKTFVENFADALSGNFNIVDRDLSEIAFRSFELAKPFNLSLTESKNIGAAIGCDYFLLIKAETQRRAAFDKPGYFEAYAIIYTVSSRTGRLVFWKLQSLQAPQKKEAEKLLFDSIETLSAEISEKIPATQKKEIAEKPVINLEEIPEENTPEAKNFRPPLPYQRIRPKYTETAGFYRVEATVDIEIDVDADGNILRTEINRWAGFGLDESVTKTVRQMQWRPASRGKKTLPIRALLRYNFKNVKD